MKFNKQHIRFLEQLMVNDNNRTPLSLSEKKIISVCLLFKVYDSNEQILFNKLRDKYKDHVWGTKI